MIDTTYALATFATTTATGTQQTNGGLPSFDIFMVEAALNCEEATPTQSLDEFKKEFYQWIGTVPVHPSQAGASLSISIHDNVFEKMMNDPEYKTEVQNTVREHMGADFSIASPAYCTMRLDADGVYSGSAYGSAYGGFFAKESTDSFWSGRAGRSTDDDKDIADKYRDKQKYLNELLNQRAQERRARQTEAQENYFTRFNADGEVATPYSKTGTYVSPSLDFFQIIAGT